MQRMGAARFTEGALRVYAALLLGDGPLSSVDALLDAAGMRSEKAAREGLRLLEEAGLVAVVRVGRYVISISPHMPPYFNGPISDDEEKKRLDLDLDSIKNPGSQSNLSNLSNRKPQLVASEQCPQTGMDSGAGASEGGVEGGEGERYVDTTLRYADTTLRYVDTGVRYPDTIVRSVDTTLRYPHTGVRYVDTGEGSVDTVEAADDLWEVRCAEVDALEDGPPTTLPDSPFMRKRAAQRPVVEAVWRRYLPDASPLSASSVSALLKEANNRTELVLRVAQFMGGQIEKGRSFDYPVAYAKKAVRTMALMPSPPPSPPPSTALSSDELPEETAEQRERRKAAAERYKAKYKERTGEDWTV